MIYSFCGGPIPAYGSKQSSPFPFAKTGLYTPFNTYDITFFLVWICHLSALLALFHLLSQKRNAPPSTSDAGSVE